MPHRPRNLAAPVRHARHASLVFATCLLSILWVPPLAAKVSATEKHVAAEVSAHLESPLLSFETRHYTVHTNLPGQTAKRAAKHLDRFYIVYRELLSSVPGDPPGRQRVFLFKDKADYVRGLGGLGLDTGMLQSTGGLFWASQSSANLASYLGEDSAWGYDRMIETLQHEGFHQFAYAKIGSELPHWVNEGMAEYFEIAKLRGRRIKRGLLPADRLVTLREAKAEGELLPFGELLRLDHESWGRNMTSGSPQGHLQYLQSWITTHFLLHGDGGRYRQRFGGYLKLLAKGADSSEAFRTAFKTDDTTAFGKAVAAFIDSADAD